MAVPLWPHSTGASAVLALATCLVSPSALLEAFVSLSGPPANPSWYTENVAYSQPDSSVVPSDTAATPFTLKFKGEVSPYRVMGMFVMPEEPVVLEAVSDDPTRTHGIEVAGGDLLPLGGSRWLWTAPLDKGLYPLRIWDTETGGAMTLNAFVLVPYRRQRILNHYRIGRYQSTLLQNNPSYEVPRGFVEVTDQNQDALIAPHFTLGQFVSKQAAGFPKYLVLRERLLLQLETLLETLNQRGVTATTLRVTSGYRTPHYNRVIGSETKYSRHLYGDAADIYIDEDGDGRMDDLNHDGRVNLQDARFVSDIVEEIRANTGAVYEGGLGLYRPRPGHGPFLHVDVRGEHVEWGP